MGAPQRGQASSGSERVRAGPAGFFLRPLFIAFTFVFME
jgi:hypothetical protein